MASWDRAAMDLGLPEFTLMENASREALQVLASCCAPLCGKRVLLFMGGGNNGGDAACLARHLVDAGALPLVLHTRPLAAYRGVTGQHLRLARRCAVPFGLAAGWPSRYLQSPWAKPDIVVDGLLGTGFKGSLRPLELGLVRHINQLGEQAFVFALDIPSGLSGLSGRPQPAAVRARCTVTFQAAKPGLVLPEAAPFVGELHVRPIGIPAQIREALPASFRLMEPGLLAALPEPGAAWHKGRAGHVLVVGGSQGLTGAPHLAALGALRSGAGLVSLAAPAGLVGEIRGGCPDLMTRPLVPLPLVAASPEGLATEQGSAERPLLTDRWSPKLLEALSRELRGIAALVIGPGMGRTPGTAAFVAGLLGLPERPPAVVDADALHALATRPEGLRHLTPADVLTPHPGEAAFLLRKSAADVQTDRMAALHGLMALAPSVWLLKGAGTLVGRMGEAVAVSPLAVPQLEVGGSGDVLSGCLATLLAQGVAALHAACAGTLLHAGAGRLLAERYPLRGNTASEIAASLPFVSRKAWL